MRRKFVCGNWKMNKNCMDTKETCSILRESLKQVNDLDIAVCVPFIDIGSAIEILGDSNISVGAENMFPEDKGAFTGEISPLQIKDIGCKYVIVGHSERRKIFKETDDFINKKVRKALEYNIIPILCVGEKLEHREAGKEKDIVKEQLTADLRDVIDVKDVVIAYEPVWAIGTGKTATPEQAQEMISYIRGLVRELYSEEAAEKIRILYGGSINPENANTLFTQPDIDGGLIGGASLEADTFVKIVKFR